MRGPLLFSMENPLHQLDFYGKQVLDRPEEVLLYETLVERLMQVTAEEVRSLAAELFVTDKLNLAVVGPAANQQELLKKLEV